MNDLAYAEISRDDYGDAWPFTVENGILIRVLDPDGQSQNDQIVFVTGGRRYALQGDHPEYLPIAEILRDQESAVQLEAIIERGRSLSPEPTTSEQYHAQLDTMPIGSLRAMSANEGGALISLYYTDQNGNASGLTVVINVPAEAHPGRTAGLLALIQAIQQVEQSHFNN